MRFLSVVLLIFGFFASLASAAPPAGPQNPASISVPVAGTGAGGATFNGTFKIQRFAQTEDGNLAAVGLLTGVLTADGKTSSVVQNVAWVRNPVPAATGGIVIQQAACEILHLDLGPLNLNILGLQIDLSRIVLDITAVPGAGNLLGNLLCAIAGLLDPAGPLDQLVQLLNQLLGVLG